MLHIAKDEDEIIRSIVSRNYYCKVLLKTAEDPILFPLWLDHHLQFFTPEQIIIADNGSADDKIISLYDNISKDITIFTYSGDKSSFHNNIHDRSKFPNLYSAIQDSCKYLISVDTDEFLYVADDNSWSTDPQKLQDLLEQAQGKAVSTTWVYTTRGATDTFYIGEGPQKLAWDLRWGKPFVPTTFAGGGVHIHNTQFPIEIFNRDLGANFFLLHLTYFSREQRLRVNKRKLIARSAAKAEESYEEIVARNYEAFRDPTITRVVSEISGILRETWPAAPATEVGRLCARYAAGGGVEYGSPEAVAAMAGFRSDFRRHFEAGFAPHL